MGFYILHIVVKIVLAHQLVELKYYILLYIIKCFVYLIYVHVLPIILDLVIIGLQKKEAHNIYKQVLY